MKSIKIGITGGSGTGKSTICNILKNFGIPVFNADYEAKYIMNNDNLIKAQIMLAYGKDSYTNENKLNARFLSEIVFKNKKQLKKLNSIVHPSLIKKYQEWVTEQKTSFNICDSALIFEAKLNNYLDYVITVYAPKELRIDRLITRDDVSLEEIKRRINNQRPDETKISLSDFTIINDSKNKIIPQLFNIIEQIYIKEKLFK